MSGGIKVGVDVSCVLARPLTGVGYATIHFLRAMAAHHPEISLALFASSARPDAKVLDWMDSAIPRSVAWWPTRIKSLMWTKLAWPAIERWTGPIDIAHGAFHLLPASRSARRAVTVFDLYGLRHPEMASSKSNSRDHGLMLRHAAKHADAVLAISEHTRRECISLLGVPESRCHVVPCGVDLDEFSGDIDTEKLRALKIRLKIDGEYLLHLGTLEPRKNVPRLVQAYAQVRARRADCPPLILAGALGWQYEEVFRTVAALGLDAAVRHVGYLSRQDAVLLLRGARGCVYVSLYEGFGLPVLEAMAACTPVVTSNTTAMPEVAGNTALMTDPINVDSIAAAIEDLLKDHTAARQRAAAARERATRFTWRHSADCLAEVYRSLARGAANG